MNRAFHEFNRGFDTLLYVPVTGFYRSVLPPVVQDSVHNMLTNIGSPVTIINEMLQGEFDRAWESFVRFLVNSTAGVAGVMDVATDWGYAQHTEDFGQTLAVWGVEEGAYLELPLLGPSNPRDAVGVVVDFLMDPFNWWLRSDEVDKPNAIYARTGMRAVDYRAQNFDILQDLEKSSLDYYATLRSLYRQRRADEIRNGDVPVPSGPGSSELDGPAPNPSDGGELSRSN